MIYGYCRISTIKQEDGTSLDAQEKEILTKYPHASIIREVYSGAKERPLFNKLVEETVSGDMIVCTKLDRFCRKTKEGLEAIAKLQEKGVSIHILNMGLIDDTPMGRLITTCLLAFAEYERDQIHDRCQGARQRLRETDPNYKEGRPRIEVKGEEQEMALVALGLESQRAAARKLHIGWGKFWKDYKEFIAKYEIYGQTEQSN